MCEVGKGGEEDFFVSRFGLEAVKTLWPMSVHWLHVREENTCGGERSMKKDLRYGSGGWSEKGFERGFLFLSSLTVLVSYAR